MGRHGHDRMVVEFTTTVKPVLCDFPKEEWNVVI